MARYEIAKHFADSVIAYYGKRAFLSPKYRMLQEETGMSSELGVKITVTPSRKLVILLIAITSKLISSSLVFSSSIFNYSMARRSK